MIQLPIVFEWRVFHSVILMRSRNMWFSGRSNCLEFDDFLQWLQMFEWPFNDVRLWDYPSARCSLNSLICIVRNRIESLWLSRRSNGKIRRPTRRGYCPVRSSYLLCNQVRLCERGQTFIRFLWILYILPRHLVFPLGMEIDRHC